jgi:cobalt-zinc-cadmium efflux system outer membrane protein
MPGGHNMPGMQGGNIEEVIKKSPSNFLPPLGSAQVADAQQVITLDDLEQRAIRNNPTLRQAQSEIRAARGRTTQAGLWPNPTIGYSGEEIRGGQLAGGQHGGFIEQRFVLGRKLALSRNIADREVAIAEVEGEEQKLRVLTAVRVAYFQVLASQEALNLARHNIDLTKANLASSQRFNNIGQTDRSEVLQADIEVQRQELAASIEETRLRRDWQMLAALIGEPTLPLSRVEGRLEQDLPSENGQQLLDSLLSSSPATKIADTNVSRSEAIFARSRRESIPDLTVRAGLQQNNESLETANRKVGLQGFAEVGVQIPIFNRNQGNVSAARAELDRAKAEAERVRLVLRQRASATVQSYNMSQQMVSRYQRQILPKAQQLFEMQLKAWGQMTASYPQVLIAQQTLFSAQRDYIQALQQLRTSSLALRGFLLTDGLEAPSRPGEVDMPVRELNLPSAGGTER